MPLPLVSETRAHSSYLLISLQSKLSEERLTLFVLVCIIRSHKETAKTHRNTILPSSRNLKPLIHIMKNVIALAIVSLFVVTSTVSGQASSEPNAQPASQKKNQETALSANTGNGSTPGSNADSSDAEAMRLYESALSLSEAGKLDEAIEAFKQSLRLKPEDPQSNFSLGMTYSKVKNYKEAFESFKKATKFRPDWADAHFRVGVMSYVLGKKSQASEEYRKLLEFKSPLANILYRIIKADLPPSEIAPNVGETDPLAVAARVDGTATPITSTDEKNATPKSTTENTVATEPTSSSTETTAGASLTETYKVGIGDVLDIRFLNSATAGRSTLFTVVGGGVIDYPVAGGPIAVAGLTTDEIQARLAAELKRRAIEDNARISVGVRQYVSHSVVINGLVASPGARILRREAVPLYVVLAESQLRNDAGRAVIMRNGSSQTLDLADSAALNTTVMSGDVITVTARPVEYYYIAGRINYPGQKNFQSGISLLQAILAAGGVRQGENIVEISREGTDGRLVTTRYNLKQIKAGEIGDPKVQPGDRIEVIK